jgi:hypothetical protein
MVHCMATVRHNGVVTAEVTHIPVSTDTQITTDGLLKGVFRYRSAPGYKRTRNSSATVRRILAFLGGLLTQNNQSELYVRVKLTCILSCTVKKPHIDVSEYENFN